MLLWALLPPAFRIAFVSDPALTPVAVANVSVPWGYHGLVFLSHQP